MTQETLRVGIAGLGSCVPDRVMTNDDFARIVDTNDEWIRQRTGIQERRWVEPGQNCSDLSTVAAQRALEDAGLTAADVDLIVLGTISGDYMMPSTACLVQARLGATKAGAFDVQAACSGFLTALATARAFIASGQARTVLAIGAETLSRFVDRTDRTSCILFGDGAGAAVVRPFDDCGRGEILGGELGADGAGYDYIWIPVGGARTPHNDPEYDPKDHFIRLRGREVYRFAVTKMTELISRAIAGHPVDQVGIIVPHQVNLRIIESALERLGWDEERCFINIQRYGNTSAASVPIALDEAYRAGRLEKGKLCVLVAFGAGLTWGSTLIRW